MITLNISLEDLVIAYRKAKVDAFYESGHNTAILFAEYEINLLRNLKNLQSKLNSDNSNWIQEASFVGSFALLLKSVQKEDKRKNIYFSDSKKQWSDKDRAAVDFRIIGQHSVNFHILSSLWIDKVGYRIETRVSENSYGCRLKRPGQTWSSFVNEANKNSKPSKLQLGHFRSYISDYKKWQKNGIRAIQSSLKEEPRVIVTTFDLRKFYHRIDPRFLLENSFIEQVLETTYSSEEKGLTELLVLAIEFWSKQIISNPIIPQTFKVNDHCGVPLGLGASKIFANLILINIDSEIEKKLKPIFYGRYVDDFFIVLKDKTRAIQTTEDLWNYFSSKLKGLSLKSESLQSDVNNYEYELPYSRSSRLEFGRDKEKIFVLEGTSGEALAEKILKDLDDNSSEWKMLPDAEENLDELTRGIVSSSSDESDEVPSFRKADKVSLQRLNFALRLRDYETMVGLTPYDLWKDGLDNFFKLSLDFIFSADNIPIYHKYYPRIIRLAIKAKKSQALEDILDRHENSWTFLKEKVNVNGDRQLLDKCHEYGNKLIGEALVTSIPIGDKRGLSKWKRILQKLGVKLRNLSATSEKLFFADLHSIPFRRVFLDETKVIPNGWGQNKYALNGFHNEMDSSILKLNTRKAFLRKILKTASAKSPKQEFVPKALFFFTRPHNMIEITFLIPDWCKGYRLSELNSILSLFNLPEMPASIPKIKTEALLNNNLREIQIPTLDEAMNPSFALTSFETKDESWVALVSDAPTEPDSSRYSRLFQLLNEMLRRKEIINYAVFPELSIPRNVIFYLASKLKTKNISLIAGVEYEKSSSKKISVKDQVSNQLMYVLNTHSRGRYEQLVIFQEKVEPAIHEKSGLRKYGKKKLISTDQSKFLINHGGFYFSGLICNDFLNIKYRESLRGLVDALVVVEWNKDTETYDSLVQSSSNDLHCFVMQVNNRSYGDTRLRAPYKEVYMRDLVRIRGGEFDYFVLATLDVEAIRKFQKKQPSPKQPFKPTPTGYKMSNSRK